MATIFSKIIAGEIPSYKVAEDDRFYAFLDINPMVKGHTLVVPKREVDYIFDLEDEELAAICQTCGTGHPESIPLPEGRRSGIGLGSASCTHPSDSDAKRERHAVLQSETATER